MAAPDTLRAFPGPIARMLPPPAVVAHVPDALRVAQRLAWAREATCEPALTLERASVDAGFRSYWRAPTTQGSRIVMDSPPDLEDARPWLRLRTLLDAHGIRVPALLAEDAQAGFLLLEDLGPSTALQALAHVDRDTLLETALRTLVRLQAIPVPDDLPRYDAAMLQRELDLFEAWFLGRHLGVTLSEIERVGLHDVQARLIDNLLAQPQGFVHRDYMLRNLMPVGDDLAVIDFQGAVHGPLAYDPVSLFRDAFHSWPDAVVETGLDRHHALARAAGLPLPALVDFRRDADFAGMQRHLKILGLFARLHYRDGKPKYLADAPRFVGYLDRVLPRYPELAPLSALLDRHVRAHVPA